MGAVDRDSDGWKRAVCACGRHHEPVDMQILIQESALEQIPRVVREMGHDRATALFDATTYDLFGGRISKAFRGEGLRMTPVVLGTATKPFEPDGDAVETSLAALGTSPTAVLGVGSGAINDLGKYVAHRCGIPYVSGPTAPSMDGYAAPISALLLDGVKTTFDTKMPDAVIGDLGVLTGAPAHLSGAGFGDMLGKFTSLRDWEIGHALFQEYWCPAIAASVEGQAAALLRDVEDLARQTLDSTEALLRGLVDVGISVAHVGSSRPTSGSEHLISHFVEMWASNRGERPPLHGHVVGLTTLLVSEIAHMLRRIAPDDLPDRAPRLTASMATTLSLIRVNDVPANFGVQKYVQEVRDTRFQIIRRQWPRLRAIIEKIPSPATIRGALTRMHCPVGFESLGIDKETARSAVTHARFLRERYTLLDVAADIGVLDDAADELVAKYG